MTRGWLAAIAVQAIAVVCLGVLVLDMRAHNRVEQLGGVNVWGYRGTELGRKQENDVRVAVVGGDLAFGWGVRPVETLVSYTGRLVSLDLNRAGQRSRPVSAVVLAAQGMAPEDYAGWIQHFSDLKLDIICIVLDEPGHRLSSSRYLPDRHSLLFASTGYSPILPLVVREKSVQTRSAVLGAAARLLDAVDLEAAPALGRSAGSADAIGAAVRSALSVATIGTILVLPPRSTAAPAVVDDPRVRVVRLDADPQLRGDDLRVDRYHFGAGGHARAAELVAPVALDLIRAQERTGR